MGPNDDTATGTTPLLTAEAIADHLAHVRAAVDDPEMPRLVLARLAGEPPGPDPEPAPAVLDPALWYTASDVRRFLAAAAEVWVARPADSPSARRVHFTYLSAQDHFDVTAVRDLPAVPGVCRVSIGFHGAQEQVDVGTTAAALRASLDELAGRG